MNSLNSILIEGNVVRDPVIKETPRGSTVCNFSIASNRFYKQDDGYEQETSFFEVESWAKLAETCSKNCGKGRGVRVVGRLKQDRWIGSNGKNCTKIKVVADHVEFKPRFKNGVIESNTEIETDSAQKHDEDDSANMLADFPATPAESLSEVETSLVF